MPLKNTLLQKVLFLFFIILIPFIMICTVLLFRQNILSKQQILSTSFETNTTRILQLDDSLRQLTFTSMPLLGQSNVLLLANSKDRELPADKRSKINLLREQSTNICSTNPYLKEIHIYFKNMNRVFHSSNSTLGSFHNFTDNEYLSLLEIAKQPKTIHPYYNTFSKQKTLSIFLTPLWNNPTFLVELTLSPDDIDSILSSNNLESQELYLLKSDTDILFTNMDSDMQSSVSNILSTLSPNNYSVISLENQNYYISHNELPYLKAEYIRLIPLEFFFPHAYYTAMIYFLFLLLIIIPCIVFFVGIYRLVHKPLKQLIDAFCQLENGNFEVTIQEKKSSDFSYLYRSFNVMTQRLQNLIQTDYQQKILLQKAELKHLQAQITPHFLYNSFFMLQRMIKMDNLEDAEKMANALALYFRYITKNSTDQVPLLEEYIHSKNYAYIQGLRYQGRIEIELDELPADCEKIAVPKLILQPIIENAFFYGLDHKIKDGLLKITFDKTATCLLIIIEDNGDTLTEEKLQTLHTNITQVQHSSIPAEMTGILNISRRLAIFTKTESSVTVDRSKLGGLKIVLSLTL